MKCLSGSHWVRTWMGVGLAVLCVNPSHLPAQGIDLGARVGVGLTGILWGDASMNDQTEPAAGFHLGLLARRGLKEWSFLEGGLLYSRRGTGDGGGLTGAVVMDYLEVPLTLGIRLPGGTSPYLRGGPVLGFDLRCRLTGVAALGSTACDDPTVGVAVSSLDMGALLGVGLERTIGGQVYSLEFQGTLGLLDLTGNPLPPGFARNISLAVSLGVRHPSGNRRGGGS